MLLKDLIKSLDNSCAISGKMDFQIKGIACNSKAVKEGFIFVAVKGASCDGSAFINEAVSKGAVAVVTEKTRLGLSNKEINIPFIKVKDARSALARLAAKFYGDPALKVKVVGVTGTNGKTTITYLMESLLKYAGSKPALIGTVNYRFGDKVFDSNNTTPGPIQLQSLLADMVKERVQYLIMEVSSHALSQDRVASLRFHSAVFTNLTSDHLDYHKTIASYFRAKSKLFTGLDPSSLAIINNDDKYGRKIKQLTGAKVITYGIDNGADVMAKNIKLSASDTKFSVVSEDHKIDINTSLIGRHNVYNILASVAWALQIGIKPVDISRSMAEFSFVPGRLEKIDSENKFSVFVDYAHTEDALFNVIKALKGIGPRRIIVVFGCGGDRDKTKRPKMGRVVSQMADYAIITNDNPRSENPEGIIRDIQRGMGKKNYQVIPDRFQAIRHSLYLAQKGDIVLVAGKGHENYQILRNEKLHFDDREVVRECLKLMN